MQFVTGFTRRKSLLGWMGALLLATMLSGCSEPENPAVPAKEGQPPKATAPAATPAQPAAKSDQSALVPEPPSGRPQEQAATPEPPLGRSEGPAMIPEPPSGGPAEPAAKPAETATPEPSSAKSDEPAMLPEPPAGNPAEPAAKPEEAAKPDELAAKPAEPAAQPDGPGDAAPAGSPPIVKVSAFAPADDLVKQVDAYLKEFDTIVESEQQYKDEGDKLVKDANTLSVIALALGLHDQDNQYKGNAGALIKAAQELAAANDYAAAKKAVEAVKAAAASKESDGELKWEKVASLEQLMKKVPLVNSKLKLNVGPKRFKSKAQEAAGFAAVIGAIAQASMADTHEAKTPDDVQKWYGFCVQLRDAAGAVNKSIHGGDQAATDAAMAKLAQSCDDCHNVFHQAAPAAANPAPSK